MDGESGGARYLRVAAVGRVAQRVQQRGGQRQQLAGQQRVGAVPHRVALAARRQSAEAPARALLRAGLQLTARTPLTYST